MNQDTGQDQSTWDHSWADLSLEREIQMWDFYGLRPWILKYLPRYGKVLEAGCGLGRNVFYFRHLGVDIQGLDFSESGLKEALKWDRQQKSHTPLVRGDVTQLPYPDDSLMGYVSLGVVEHFIEGPSRPLEEAFRVLKPGGVAIITTPNTSFYIRFQTIRTTIKTLIKKIIRKKIGERKFFQYWYSPKVLKNWVEKSGFNIRRASGADFLYTFNEIGNFTGNNLKPRSFAYKFSHKYESTWLNRWASQSCVIAIKAADLMYCFLCGQSKTSMDSLSRYDIPICPECQPSPQSQYYLKGLKPSFAEPYVISPPILPPTQHSCTFCKKPYEADPVFEGFGFSKPVCQPCLRKPAISIELSNTAVKPVWRKRN